MQASRKSVRTHQSFGSIGSSVSTGFQVYLSKCWDLYASPGFMIQFVFFCNFLPYFSTLILSLPLLGLGSKSTSLSPGFFVCRRRQYDTIFWEMNLSSGFFSFLWLIFLADGINKCGWCLAGGKGC